MGEQGAYLLVVELKEASKISVGALGKILFPEGYYVYAGSALGPGDISARITRHKRREKRRHWHIDYLLEEAKIVDVVEFPLMRESNASSRQNSRKHQSVQSQGSAQATAKATYTTSRVIFMTPSNHLIPGKLVLTKLALYLFSAHNLQQSVECCKPPLVILVWQTSLIQR